MKQRTIEIYYPGNIISVNHFKYRGRYTRQETKQWMTMLGYAFKPYHFEDWNLPLTVVCSGRFKDKRSQPDLSNLSKVILDELEEVTEINDKNFRWQDGEVTYGDDPKLFITIMESKLPKPETSYNAKRSQAKSKVVKYTTRG